MESLLVDDKSTWKNLYVNNLKVNGTTSGSGLNIISAQIAADGSITYQTGAKTIAVTRPGGAGVYSIALSDSALAKCAVASSSLAGGLRVVNCEITGTNSFVVSVRDKAEVGNDSAFCIMITWA